jgi:antitoxin component YwqK of YwqJK toxin-antitoxin module
VDEFWCHLSQGESRSHNAFEFTRSPPDHTDCAQEKSRQNEKMARNCLVTFCALLTCTACFGAGKANLVPQARSQDSPTASELPSTNAEAQWWTNKSPCPDGAALSGAAPPAGKAVGCERDGARHGPRMTFHESGRRARSEAYYRGKLQGRYMQWYDSGALEEEGIYRDGLLEGQFARYYANGNERTKGEYHRGKETGTFVTYSETGARLEEVEYREGKKHGIHRAFYETGKLREAVEYAGNVRQGRAGRDLAFFPRRRKTSRGAAIRSGRQGRNQREVA